LLKNHFEKCEDIPEWLKENINKNENSNEKQPNILTDSVRF